MKNLVVRSLYTLVWIKLFSLATLTAVATGPGGETAVASSETIKGTMTWNEMPMVRAATNSRGVTYVMKYHINREISEETLEKIQGWLADPTLATNAANRTSLATELKASINALTDTHGIKALEILAGNVAVGGPMTEWVIGAYEDVKAYKLSDERGRLRYLEISREAVIATKEDFQLVVSYVRDHNQTKGRDILANVFANDAVVAELLQR